MDGDKANPQIAGSHARLEVSFIFPFGVLSEKLLRIRRKVLAPTPNMNGLGPVVRYISSCSSLRQSFLTNAPLSPQLGIMRHRLESDFEDESHFSPISLVRRTHSPDRSQDGSFSAAHQERDTNYLKSTVFKSAGIVMLKAKINLMLPFGPAAILVHKFYGHEVSFMILLALFPGFVRAHLVQTLVRIVVPSLLVEF